MRVTPDYPPGPYAPDAIERAAADLVRFFPLVFRPREAHAAAVRLLAGHPVAWVNDDGAKTVLRPKNPTNGS